MYDIWGQAGRWVGFPGGGLNDRTHTFVTNPYLGPPCRLGKQGKEQDGEIDKGEPSMHELKVIEIVPR